MPTSVPYTTAFEPLSNDQQKVSHCYELIFLWYRDCFFRKYLGTSRNWVSPVSEDPEPYDTEPNYDTFISIACNCPGYTSPKLPGTSMPELTSARVLDLLDKGLDQNLEVKRINPKWYHDYILEFKYEHSPPATSSQARRDTSFSLKRFNIHKAKPRPYDDFLKQGMDDIEKVVDNRNIRQPCDIEADISRMRHIAERIVIIRKLELERYKVSAMKKGWSMGALENVG